MKVSVNWLREMVELPPNIPELVDLLTLSGIEVENLERRGVAIANVVVGLICESVQHPNADRLSVCQVDDGSGPLRQIVCGAKNYKVGNKVPLALPGATLPGDFKIKVGKLRGVESQGMMCSAKELELAEDAEGLLILPADSRVGAPLSEVFPADTILDLEITPNRPDLLSVVGIAREIAALSKVSLRVPQLRVTEFVAAREDVDISTPACWLYSARQIKNLKVGPSPEWLASKLTAVGLRPINNVVDITNYVMLELGQPLHAFDATRLRGQLRVRAASEGEQFLALDRKTYRLVADDIVIADDERAVALGGVMGGEDSGVTDGTTTVWLESADFQPQSIRRTSRRLGLISDSSYRFERGIDWEAVLYASQRATELITEIAGGQAVAPLRLGYSPTFNEDAAKPEDLKVCFPSMPTHDKGGESRVETVSRLCVVPSLGGSHSWSVELRPARVASLLGVAVSESEIHDILNRLGLKFEGSKWWVPSFRSDLTREVDLIEEIARVVGMDVIPSRTQTRFAPASATDRFYDRAMELRHALVAQGLHEARSITLVPEQPLGLAFTQTSPESLRRVKNPMIDDQVVLRPNLLHGLLRAVGDNVRAGAKSIRLFEIGRVYSTDLPEEFSHLAIVLSGPTAERSWRAGEGSEADLFHLKGVVAAVLGGDVTFVADQNSALALSLVIKVAGQPVGFAGQLWLADARALDATAPVIFGEIDLAKIEDATKRGGAKKYREIPRFPATTRDIALLAPLALTHDEIVSTVHAANEPLLANIELFDVFTDPTGTKVPVGQKSLAYSLTYRVLDRTLTAEEVNAAHARVKGRLKMQLGVTLRE